MGKVIPDPTLKIAGGDDRGDDTGVLGKLEEWFTESKTYMETQRERWRKNERLYYNEITLCLPAKHTQLKYAIPLAVIETELPILSDYLPTFDVQPREEDDIQYADLMQRRKAALEEESGLKDIMMDTCKDSLIYSDGILRILPKMRGDTFAGIDMQVVDPFTWFPAPGATDMDIRKARYQIFATPMHVDEIERQYGVKVGPEGFLDEYRCFHVAEGKEEGEAMINQALVKECYRMDPDGKTYPFGRLTIWANGKLLDDEPLWEDADPNDDYVPPIPYFPVSNYGTAHSMFGVGETYLVRTQAQCLNEVMSALAETVKKTGNPIRKVLSSWVSAAKKKIMGVAGEEIIVNSPMDVSWETPPQVPASTFQFVELMMRLTDVVTGVHDVTEGKRPEGITAASAILALQEAAQTRIRYKVSKEIGTWVKEIGKYLVWMLKTYDTEVRTLRKATESGAYEFIPYDPTSVRGKSFDIQVVAGTRMPTGRYADEERAKEKFAAGIYGIEDYVNASSEPNKQQIIEGWYRRQGLEMAKAHQEELNEAMAQFEPLVEMAVQAPDRFAGSPEEEQAAALVQRYPELLQTGEFEALPAGVKERVLMVFVGNEQERNA